MYQVIEQSDLLLGWWQAIPYVHIHECILKSINIHLTNTFLLVQVDQLYIQKQRSPQQKGCFGDSKEAKSLGIHKRCT